jgi:hypothetical protein
LVDRSSWHDPLMTRQQEKWWAGGGDNVGMDQRGAIEAALSALSVRWGEPYEVLAVPDEEERELPAVDLLVQGRGGRLLVVEHTILESFADRIRDDMLVSDFAAQVESALAGRLPNPGHYRVGEECGKLLARSTSNRALKSSLGTLRLS